MDRKMGMSNKHPEPATLSARASSGNPTTRVQTTLLAWKNDGCIWLESEDIVIIRIELCSDNIANSCKQIPLVNAQYCNGK